MTALVASGIPPKQITSLAVLVSPENFKLILRRRFEQVGQKPNAFNDGLAQALLAIAREWVKPSPEVLLELKNLSSRLPTLQPGLTEKNKVLLRAFDDENLQSELLNLPEFLLQNALQKRPSVRSLADAQAALAIALLPYCALRMANLAKLEFGRTLFLPKRDGDEAVVEFPPGEMKNRRPYQAALPPKITAMVRAYRSKVLEPLVGVGARFLFDNGAGHPKLPTTISWLIDRTSQRHLGIKITGHQFRHIVAKLILDQVPGGHLLVKEHLGHEHAQTTTTYYAGLDTRRASRFQAALIEKIRAGKEHSRAPLGNGGYRRVGLNLRRGAAHELPALLLGPSPLQAEPPDPGRIAP